LALRAQRNSFLFFFVSNFVCFVRFVVENAFCPTGGPFA
jgi:hypothetical protein